MEPIKGAPKPIVVDIPCPAEREGGDYTDLRDGVRRLLAEGYKLILVNVAQVTYGDSVLLGAIMQAYTAAIRQGATLKLLHVSVRFRELLAVTKLDRVLESDDPKTTDGNAG